MLAMPLEISSPSVLIHGIKLFVYHATQMGGKCKMHQLIRVKLIRVGCKSGKYCSPLSAASHFSLCDYLNSSSKLSLRIIIISLIKHIQRRHIDFAPINAQNFTLQTQI